MFEEAKPRSSRSDGVEMGAAQQFMDAFDLGHKAFKDKYGSYDEPYCPNCECESCKPRLDKDVTPRG